MENNNKPVLERLGDFEVLRELGRGGMGIVYEARQVSLNRKVALKVLSGGLGLTTQAVTRFRREAAAAAKLHHTNIVPIYSTGDSDGMHYYAMELVEGPSLDKVIKQMRREQKGEPAEKARGTATSASESLAASMAKTVVDNSKARGPSSKTQKTVGETSSSLGEGASYFDTVARMMAEVADGLDYAHKQGVIHRDIKPSNLLLSPEGRLSINDFGLARMLEEPGMTISGEFVGSPLYMSPEQITAGRTPLDHRTDLYSLGATLYQLLTLEPPFPGESRDQILNQIIHKEPKQPRKINRKIPVDLETICLKAIEKDPDRRYQSGVEMAEDLRRYVNRFAISARRAGPIGRTVKWARRHPAFAGLGLTIVFLLLITGSFAYQVRVAKQQLAAQMQRQALDDALTVAMSGDLEGTEEAIKRAELLKASPGELRFLRGLVAYHRGEYLKAMEEFEQVTQLAPKNVAAWAMLLRASNLGGAWTKRKSIQEALDQLTPKTPEELLFKAVAEPTSSSNRLELANSAVAKRPTWAVGYSLRAIMRVYRAMDLSDNDLANFALEDARWAEKLAPGSPVAIQHSFWVHLTAAVIAEKAGQVEKHRELMKEAQVRFDRLKGNTNPLATFMRSGYLRVIGQEQAMVEELKQESKRSELIRYRYATVLYGQGKVGEAWEVFSQSPAGQNPRSDWGRICVLAELSEDGLSKALAFYQDLARRNNRSISPNVLRVLGQDSDATVAFRRQRDEEGPNPNATEFEKRISDFRCGDASAEDLLKAAEGSRENLSNAHFEIGVGRLGRGDRAGASEQFKKCVDVGIFYFIAYEWAHAFLARMDKDPAWPPWIPVKK